MNHIIVGIFFIFVLTACDTLSLLRDAKIADSFYVGSNKLSILEKFGNPNSTMQILNGHGECYNYNHTLPNGSKTPIFVGFRNTDNKVVSYGNLTCEDAKTKGFLNKNTPIEQKF